MSATGQTSLDVLDGLSDEDIQKVLRETGSLNQAAQKLGVVRSTFQRVCRTRGITTPTRRGRSRRITLTKESLEAALVPPNNCKVKVFLGTLEQESLGVVEEALGYNKQDFPAAQLRDWLIGAGFREEDVPGQDAINDHRAGRRPCRCKG